MSVHVLGEVADRRAWTGSWWSSRARATTSAGSTAAARPTCSPRAGTRAGSMVLMEFPDVESFESFRDDPTAAPIMKQGRRPGAAGVHGARAGRGLRPLKNPSHRGGLCESLVTCPTWRSVRSRPTTPRPSAPRGRSGRGGRRRLAVGAPVAARPLRDDAATGLGRRAADAASWRWSGDRAVGTARLHLSERDNTHLAWLWLAIRPDEHRRRGYGSAFFELMAEQARRAGRTSLGTDGWESERTTGRSPPGTAWSGSRRGSCAASTSPSWPPGRVPASCTTRRRRRGATTSWSGSSAARRRSWSTPMVELVAAINDAPTDDLDIEDEVFVARAAGAPTRTPTLGPRQPALPAGGPAPRDRGARRAHGGRRRGAAPDARRPARHRRRPGAPRPPARAAAEGRDAAVAGRGRAAGRDRRHLERRVQRPHDRGQRGAGLPGDGPRAAVPAGLARGSVAGGEDQRAVVGDRDGVLHVRARGSRRRCAASSRPGRCRARRWSAGTTARSRSPGPA